MLSRPSKQRQEDCHEEPTIGVLTALPKEYAATGAMLDARQSKHSADGTPYSFGTMPSSGGGAHRVVVGLLTETGNNQSAVASANMLRDFPTISEIVFVGIAGAVPDTAHAERHVRLGDIVVSGREGIVQYDLGKLKGGKLQRRPPPRPPSWRFLTAMRHFEAELLDRGALKLELDRGSHLPNSSRPAPECDRLRATPPGNQWLVHPTDARRREGEPLTFCGAIAAGNVVVKDAVLRDQLRTECCALAIEMEGSGLADAAHAASVPCFVVRGTCDYCDSEKNDVWQEYAALVAAGFLRRLLSGMAEVSTTQSFANRLKSLGGALRRCLVANKLTLTLHLSMAVFMAACCAAFQYHLSGAATVWEGAFAGAASIFVPLYYRGRLEWVLTRVTSSRSLLAEVNSGTGDMAFLIERVDEFLEGCRRRCGHG